MRSLLNYFDENNIDVSKISFNRFENEPHEDLQADVLVAIGNLITSLATMKANHEAGNPPSPEE
ncbi:hypothetical protein EQG49_02230 [Periweissella cryptocerci]|uniref:Uncharacterized protein n=1 Tax=Periweissella cryptocerci TaxID=2506420 RepID=A0A4P6YX25_9LACO|nr:hypothetical protein EQG49_02230 [Periweissella cryptocerci]